jgi:alpha,alpha-trehalase
MSEKRVSVRPRIMAKSDSRAPERAGSRLITIIAVVCCTLDAHPAGAQIASCAWGVPPSEQLGELFRNVQLKGIFADSKTFADLHFDESPNAILTDYEAR